MDNESRVTGWWVFAGILLGLAGFLNVVWGIAGVSNSKFFTPNSVWVLSSLHTWGWITLIIGVIQLIAAFSLFSGGGFGRVIGIVAARYRRDRGACRDWQHAVLVDLRVRPVRHRRVPALQAVPRRRDVADAASDGRIARRGNFPPRRASAIGFALPWPPRRCHSTSRRSSSPRRRPGPAPWRRRT